MYIKILDGKRLRKKFCYITTIKIIVYIFKR